MSTLDAVARMVLASVRRRRHVIISSVVECRTCNHVISPGSNPPGMGPVLICDLKFTVMGGAPKRNKNSNTNLGEITYGECFVVSLKMYIHTSW